MLETANQPKIVILGVGNLLLRDEEVGNQLSKTVNRDDLGYTNLEIIDDGTSPEILSLVESADELIIIDAVNGGRKPRTIYRFGIDGVNSHSAARLFVHQIIDVVDNLRILDLLGKQPKSTVIIGIDPETIDWGLELSSRVQKKMPEISTLAMKAIKETK